MGGKYGAIPISAKKGTNVDLLLERILFEADLLELKANPDRNARGTVMKRRSTRVAASLQRAVQKGSLRVGDPFVAGNEYGKVRAMTDERESAS